MRDLDCQSHHNTASGFLNSTQTVTWDGAVLPAKQYASLAARMDEEHIAAIGSSVLKFIRCHAEEDQIVCRGFGVLPLLTFGRPVTETDANSVRRTWVVTGGLLARHGDVFGSIRFEWRQQETEGGRWRHRLIASVEGYPSRFLRADGASPASYVFRRVGDWYTDYHRRVTCGFLRRLAQWIRATAEGE